MKHENRLLAVIALGSTLSLCLMCVSTCQFHRRPATQDDMKLQFLRSRPLRQLLIGRPAEEAKAILGPPDAEEDGTLDYHVNLPWSFLPLIGRADHLRIRTNAEGAITECRDLD
ncbi:hypothetical protein Pla8534_30700 [Lignipirellula cremea]|uniref:Uncharacterized protein n=2 Tax=Lignipirellula cremea TaxID=2528010 RepID=A0A518DTU4_9BACT|nr:hypothetical protein Pla8534_30700 [Lignipirellula cremea]